MLFLMSAGLTLVRHHELHQPGARLALHDRRFAGAAVQAATGSLRLPCSLRPSPLPSPASRWRAACCAASTGAITRPGARHLRDDPALNETTRIAFRPTPLRMNLPPALSGHVEIIPAFPIPPSGSPSC